MANQHEMAEMLKRMEAELAAAKANIAKAKEEGKAEGMKMAQTATPHGCEVRAEGRKLVVTLDLDAPEKSYTNAKGKVVKLGPGIYKGTFAAGYVAAPGVELHVSTVKKS